MHLPYDGPTGSGVLRTGPLKIGKDRTGVFIRGDEARALADMLELAGDRGLQGGAVHGLIELLRSCKEPAA